MAALSAAASRKTRNRGAVRVASYAVATSVTVYQGGLVSCLLSSGRAIPSAKTASTKFLGLALDTATGNAGGTVFVTVEYNVEALINAEATLTTAYTGAQAYISTDNDADTASNAGTTLVQIPLGEVIQFEGGDAWVALRNYAELSV